MKAVYRPDTPAPLKRSRWHTLPPDILQLVSKRVRIMAVAIGGIWTLGLLIDNVFARLLGNTPMPGTLMLSEYPGSLLAALGLASSVAVLLVLPRLKPGTHGVINVGLAFQVFTAGLVALVMNWDPNLALRMGAYGDRPARISWLCLIILLQPAVVPGPTSKTLAVSLLIATMDPLAVWVVSMAGKPIDATPFALLWFFLPNYVSVVLAMIPSHIISVLARQVIQARELGSYQLGDLLGKGGMGEVYRARHRMLARPAAIKLIRPETLGAQSPEDAHVMIERFRREAEAAALLCSPHTINLYDFGVTDEGTFYTVMELLEGFNLDTLVERFGPVPAERAIFLLRDVCVSLGEAHAHGLIHRDIKPSNIFTCRLGLNVDFVKVLDFGLVKHRHDGAHPHTEHLTQPAVTTGTPAFMAPEMALEERTIDRRADIYSLGCVGYWLLTGRLVFDAETPVKMMLQHIHVEPGTPSRHTEMDVPPELDRILLQCLAKKPEDRPSDTMALAGMLAAVRVREEWTRERAEQWWANHFRLAAPPVREKAPRATPSRRSSDRASGSLSSAPPDASAPRA